MTSPFSRTLRIQLLRTQETHLVCMVCGGFRTEYAVEPTQDVKSEPQVGIHDRCIVLAEVGRRDDG